MQPILLGFLAGFIATAVWGVLFSHREEEIRGKFLRRSRGWRRKRYVRAMIEGVQGASELANIRLVTLLFVLLPPVVAVGYTYTAGFYAGRAEAMAREIAHAEALITELTSEDSDEDLSTLPDANQRVETALRIIESARDTRERSLWIWKSILLLLALLLIWNVWLIAVWRTFVLFRAWFAKELGHFIQAVQPLASKGEWVAIMTARNAVKDEESLETFISVLSETGRRHDLPWANVPLDEWVSMPN